MAFFGTFIGVVLGTALVFFGGVVLIESILEGFIRFEISRSRKKHSRAPHQAKALALAALIVLSLGFVVSWLATDRLIFGLFSLLPLPGVLLGINRWLRNRYEITLEKSAICFLYALEGLLKVGIGFPAALFRLSESFRGRFTQLLRGQLYHYEEGKALSRCLERVRAQAGIEGVGFCLAVMEMAYEKGLPVASFLERMVPLLEDEQAHNAKIRALRHSLLAQALTAVVLPWVLLSALWLLEPGMAWERISGRWFWGTVLLTLTYEALGLVVIWKISSFY